MDSQMKDLQDSIKQYGIITPVIVRPRKEGYYEIISGHRRIFAAENWDMQDVVTEFDLQKVKVNTLDITRTFLDKVMSVKRHAICGTLPRKVRHIYDVTVLLDRSDIQDFLNNTEQLKQLLKLTKETDSFYLQKRNISEDYDPLGAYAFENWKQYFNDEIRGRYETLHEDLLYTSNRQSFEKAIQAFEFISHLFASIGE